jgi:Pvc16 N-terminal domain
MSDARAIAATTMALRQLLLARIPERDPDLTDLQVTTNAPDQARGGLTGSQLNLFLYQVVTNAAWRNFDVPGRVRPSERGHPSLALDLRFLLTAWGRGDGDTDAISHRVMGAAMAVLHDQPLLGPEAVRNALATAEPLPPLIERLKITPLPLGIEEISKLWAAFQTQYRFSCAYEVTVVLIESERERRPAPPVLRRGDGNRGPVAFAEAAPALASVRLPDDRPGISPGETLTVLGQRLHAAPLEAVITRHGSEDEIVAATTTDAELDTLSATLEPTAPWRAGVWTVAVRRRHPDGTAWLSNAVPFAIAPTVHALAPTLGTDTLELDLFTTPPIAAGQKVAALVADLTAEPESTAAATLPPPAPPHDATRLQFRLARPRPGRHAVRLRVDGIDSQPYRRDPATGELGFDPAHTVLVP